MKLSGRWSVVGVGTLLEHFFPEALGPWLAAEIPYLIETGVVTHKGPATQCHVRPSFRAFHTFITP